MASNALSDIADEFLVCQICFEDFRQPKMLPCLHTFCQPCLEKLLAAEPVGKLDCPTCRQDVPLPQNGVQGLPSNFHVGKLRDILQLQPAGEVAMDKDQVGTPLGLQVRPDVMIGGASLKLVRSVGEWGSGDGQFKNPSSLAVTAEGDIVVTDCNNSRLQFLDKDGCFKKKVDLGFMPHCVAALTNGELLVAGDGYKIHVLDKQGRKSRVIQVTGAVEKDGTTRGVAVDGSARIIVTIGHQVFVLSPSGDVMLKFGDKGQGQQRLGSLLHVTVNSSNQIIVSDFVNNNLKIFDSAGRHLFTCGSHASGPGQLNSPCCVITDSEDNIIVAERNNDRVSLFSRDGAFIRHVLTRQEHGLCELRGLTLTHDRQLIVTEYGYLKFF